MAFALQKAKMHDDRVHGSRKVKVTILASEWGSNNGGLSTLNRELAIQLAKFPEVEITFFLPKCSQEDRKIALKHKVKIVEATPLSGFEQLDWLCFPPKDLQIDIIVGHGVKLGKQAQVIKDLKTCKWFQVVHTDPEELGMFSTPISKGEENHKTEVELCKMADHVVGVGPKLSDAFRSYLRGCKKDDHVLDFTPGVLEEFEAVNQDPSERQQRSVLVFGRGDVDDFELKGFDIAGKAIAALQDTRLMFVGAPDGKHEEIAKRLIECGVPASRLRVRGFAQDRESLKRLFQEVDLVVMPSRTEGFGVTGLEAMSAGLPVLVSRNSGFGEALRSAAFGSSFVIDSEEPAVWTVAIQNIWSKDRKCRLEEAVTLRDCYGRKYNWTKQIKELVDRMVSLTHEDSLNARSSLETKCNASQRMEGITEDHEEPSMEIENNQRTNSYDDEQLISEASLSSDCEVKADTASGNPTKISTNTDSQSQNSHSVLITAVIELKVSSSAQDLTVEQQRTITKELEQLAHKYQRHRDLSSLPFVSGVARLAEFIEKAFEAVVLFVKEGSLVIAVHCPSLESLESLWNGYCSGYLNDVVESFLVTDELKRNLGLDNVRLKTTIEEENYLICKKAFMDNAGVASFTETSCQTVDSGQVEDTRESEESSDVVKDKKQALTPMARAEKAKASRGSLHKAAISGQYQTVKTLLESGEDVDLRDQFSLTPLHLACWYGQESVVKLLLEHGAEVNAEDRFQRTPLQKAERQNYHSIVQLLVKNDARPCLKQPASLKKLSRKAFLQVDEQSGFNLLQAAVFEGEYSIVLNAHGLLENFVKEMELVTTGNTAKVFPGKTAGDILSLKKIRKPSHDSIERLYNEWAEENKRLTELQWATCDDDAEQAVELVLNDGVDINARASDNDYTALLQASRSSSIQFIETLIDLGADVDVRKTESEATPVLSATKWNNYLAASLFLRYGTNVNVQDDDGKTPLLWAAILGNEKLVKLLLQHNADVNIQDTGGYTPLRWSLVLRRDENLVRLFLEHNADLNIQDIFGYTPLHQLVKEGNTNLVRLLLEYNADVNIQDSYGKTPLHQSVIERDGNLVSLLLTHNADVNIQDNDGCTALHLSVLQSHINQGKILDTLVKHKAQIINTCDAKGLTPLHTAVRSGNAQAVKKLVDLGADISVVKTDEKDAVRLEILKNEAELREQHLKFEIGYPLTAEENAGDTFTQDAEILTKDRSEVKQAQQAMAASQPETIKAACSLDNPKVCFAETSDPVLHVTLLGGEWGSSAGGLSTIDRELAIHLSNHSAVKVSLLVPEGACNAEEIREADSYGITIVEAKERAAFDPLDWLSSPPKDHVMDIVVGHGLKLGRQVQFIRDSAQFPNCKWVQVVHTAPEDLNRYKSYCDPISKGETKHESEVELCKLADLVVPVGPRLKEAYTSYLQRYKTGQDVLSITPGLFQREFGDLIQTRNEHAEFKVLLFGRGDDDDFELKGYNIAAQAFTDQRLKNKPYHLIFVGAPEGKQEKVREKLLQRKIAEAQLTVRKFIQSREKLRDLLCEADLAIMPSKSEGFSLVALEALSAGLPILVGSRSGFAKALENVPMGFSCIVNSDDPAEWAKAIEAVRIRHGMRLQEINSLRASYGEMYSWKEQCEALVNRMWKMSHRKSYLLRVATEDSLKARSSLGSKCNACQRMESMTDNLKDIIIRHRYQDLTDEQEKITSEALLERLRRYVQHRPTATMEAISHLIEYLNHAYDARVEFVEMG